MFTGKPMTLLCTYPLSMSKAGDLFNVACTHHLAIARRKKRWEVIKGGDRPAPLARREKRDEALDAAGRVLSLSRRERQVLDRVAEGRPNKPRRENRFGFSPILPSHADARELASLPCLVSRQLRNVMCVLFRRNERNRNGFLRFKGVGENFRGWSEGLKPKLRCHGPPECGPPR